MTKKQLPPRNICAPLIVNEKAFCFWDANIPEINLRFINQIDSDYFEYIANLNFSILENKDENVIDKKTRQHAAVAMRLAYSQGLETLFSLMFATIQAPHCVIGWFLKYTNSGLSEIIGKFRNFQKIYIYPEFKVTEWKDFTNLVFSCLNEEVKPTLSLQLDNFSRLWSWFAQDFLDKNFENEYNSIKHGLRVQMGGFHLLIGPPQKKFGEVTPLEKIKTVAFSEFGTTFFISEKIDETPNFLLHDQSRNWNPENYYHALLLISASIKNILVFLKKFNGEKNELEYFIPNDEEFYLKPWKLGGNEGMGHKSRIKIKKEALLTKEDILSFYENQN